MLSSSPPGSRVAPVGGALLQKRHDSGAGLLRCGLAQEREALCEELLDRCTVPGELVVDFTFGSGQHLASAAKKGRRFAGSEQNPLMFETAVGLIAENYTPPVQE